MQLSKRVNVVIDLRTFTFEHLADGVTVLLAGLGNQRSRDRISCLIKVSHYPVISELERQRYRDFLWRVTRNACRSGAVETSARG